MHDEMKLEAEALLDQEAGWGNGVGRFTMVNTEITVRAIVKALARTLSPANTEADVERVAREILKRHVHPKVFADGWPLHLDDVLRAIRDALTKPPALPKEGEEAIRARARAAAEAWRVPCSVDPNDPSLCVPKDDCVFGYEQGYFDALSSLPVRSGEEERLVFHEAVKRGVDQDTADQVAQAVSAALATPQQVKEGDR